MTAAWSPPWFGGLLLLLLSLHCCAGKESPFLPQLLGTVTSPDQWPARRTQLSSLLQTHIVGTLPSISPSLTSIHLINTTSFKSATSNFYQLTFNTSQGGGSVTSVTYAIELLVPTSTAPQPEPCPLFLTQWNHRSWAVTGLSRGYCALVYPGSDVRDVAPLFQRAYPKATMMLIVARAFVASKTLEIFFNPPQHDHFSSSALQLPTINKNQICITGHSRNGKQSLLAAAIDERFTSVVGSSPGAPIASPYHLSSHNFYGEGPDAGQAGHWWLNSTLSYAAHPETLPVDGNAVLALIAPRRAAIANGWTDHEGDINFADECNIHSAMHVYRLLNASGNLRLIHRPGDHHGFDDVNTYFDWFDFGFNRLNRNFPLSWVGEEATTTIATNPFPLNYLTPVGFEWSAWYQAFKSATPPVPNATVSTVQERVQWLLQLQKEPVVYSKGATYAEDSREGLFRYPSVMMGLDYEHWKEKYSITRQPLSFGNYVTGNLFWSTRSDPNSCPIVVWLHPYSYATGYFPSYVKGGDVVVQLVQAGYCVLAYDQIGFGTRINEGGTNFYARYGATSSLFGRMVQDVTAAIDVLMCMTANGRKNRTLCGTGSGYTGPYLPFPVKDAPVLDPTRLTVAGYALGGNVALHASALDERIKSVAVFSGFTPFRTDYNNKTTGGLQRLCASS